MTSKITYLGDLRTSSIHLQSGTEIISDAPIDNYGKGEAFSPTDLAATSLASCAITILGIMANREALDLSGSKAEVTKIMTEDLPRRIAKIHVKFSMITPLFLPEDQQKKYERAAKTCPVSLSLHPDIEQIFDFLWTSRA